jgi:hypothetical protein
MSNEVMGISQALSDEMLFLGRVTVGTESERMEEVEMLNSRTEAKPRIRKRTIAPVLGLFFLAPLVAEYLLGNLPIALLPALMILAPLYGGGAILIRETVRRTGRGWPSILLLGMAYAIFEEAFTTQSLFNPDYLSLNLGLLAPAFIPALGIGAWWTLWMFNVHAIWSIMTPIALVEACVPDRARTAWLGRKGMVVVGLVFGLGAVLSAVFQYKQDPFVASPAQFSGAALTVLVLAGAAFVLPRNGRGTERGWIPSMWLACVLALAFGSAALFFPMKWGWGAVAALAALDLAALWLIVVLARREGWGLKQQLGLGAGAALAYGWHAFLQHPAVGALNTSVRIGNAIFLAGALAVIWFARKRVSAIQPDVANRAE